MFKLAKPIDECNAKELADAAKEVSAAFQSLYSTATAEGAAPTEDQLEQLEALNVLADEVKQAAEKIEQESAAEQDRADRAKALAEAHSEAPESAETESAQEEATEAESAKDESAESEPVTASTGTRFSGIGTGKTYKREIVADNAIEGFVMSQQVPKATSGAIGFTELAHGFDRMSASQSVRAKRQDPHGSSSLAMTLGTLARSIPEHLMAVDDESLTAAVEAATNERNLKSDSGEGSLIAAAGWCSPSETTYSFLDIPGTGGLVDLPEIGVSRGGIRFPVQPDFGAAFEHPGFLYTEAQMQAMDAAGEEKPCFEVPCPGFDEVRLDAIGLCVTAGILQNKGYPEAVALYLKGLVKAHQHRISSYTIQKLVAGSTAVTIPASTTIGAAGALVNSIRLAAADIRARNRIPEGDTVEIILPNWARTAVAMDLAYRRSEKFENITNAMVNKVFTDLNVYAQFVSDWQTGSAGQLGASTPASELPSTIDFLIYPAGTWFRSMEPVIEVGTLYDQAQLKHNKFTALFTEDGIAVGKRGIDSRVYTVTLDYNGAVGPAVALPDTDNELVGAGGGGETGGEE